MKLQKAKQIIRDVLKRFDSKQEKVSEILFNVYPDEMNAISEELMKNHNQARFIEKHFDAAQMSTKSLREMIADQYDTLFYEGKEEEPQKEKCELNAFENSTLGDHFMGIVYGRGEIKNVCLFRVTGKEGHAIWLKDTRTGDSLKFNLNNPADRNGNMLYKRYSLNNTIINIHPTVWSFTRAFRRQIYLDDKIAALIETLVSITGRQKPSKSAEKPR